MASTTTNLPPLSDLLNVMFTAEHLSEIMRLGNSARKRLAVIPATYEQCKIPSYLWFIHPHYLVRFVALGQQAQAEQDAQRMIGLEAALQVLSSRRRLKRLPAPILDDACTQTTVEPKVTNVVSLSHDYGNTKDLASLETRECVSVDVAIWIIDNLRYAEGYCTRCSHGATVNEYGGGYFKFVDNGSINAYTDRDTKGDYAVTCNSRGGLALYQL